MPTPRSGFQLTSWAVQNMKFARALKNPAFVPPFRPGQSCCGTLCLHPSHPAVQFRVDSGGCSKGRRQKVGSASNTCRPAASFTWCRGQRALASSTFFAAGSSQPKEISGHFCGSMKSRCSSIASLRLITSCSCPESLRSFRRSISSTTWALQAATKRRKLQVDCPRRSHIRHHHKSGKRMLCTYSSNYKTEEQRHEAVQRMKWWIIRGLEESCRQEIKKQVQKAPLSALPSDQELDAQMPPAERALTDDEGKKPRQANTKQRLRQRHQQQ